MIRQHNEVMVKPQSSVRWREWIPLATQQLRLRSLVQIVAYNVGAGARTQYESLGPRGGAGKALFYYTLHSTTMSAPFYTSEKVDNCNPKWAELEMGEVIGSVKGVVVRLWLHRDGRPDQVVTVWGVYFSGLAYLGRSPGANPARFHANTIVFRMHGGYFTSPRCLGGAEGPGAPRDERRSHVCLPAGDVRPSYTVNLLLRLQTIQRATSKQVKEATVLRERIAAGGLAPRPEEPWESAALRRLLDRGRPPAPLRRQELLQLRRRLEAARFRVRLLGEERARQHGRLSARLAARLALAAANRDRGSELTDRYQALGREVDQLREWRRSLAEQREGFAQASAQLTFRRRQLMSELTLIYPIAQVSGGDFHVCDVHLPNSEDFAASDELTISVALGFVTHLVQMISVFLQVPLRYPLCHFGSRSKIVDHIADKIPDKDREFPLFSRGKDKLQFNYGVYLLNKNIAQLRWYCGLPTQDLRATLPNLAGLLALKPSSSTLESVGRTMSGSSLDLRSSSQNASPVGSFRPDAARKRPPSAATATAPRHHFEKGHRPCRSAGNSELRPGADAEARLRNGAAVASSGKLSCSLDQGLDVFDGLRRAESGAGQRLLWACFDDGPDPAPVGGRLCLPPADTRCNNSSTDTCDSYVTASDRLEAADCAAESARPDDPVLASVASRTAALASRATSFNLVRSRRGSALDDGPS
ncbi:UV radiation resistance-associated protein-like isoform X2 [Bacillus rossius redtenbacheri]